MIVLAAVLGLGFGARPASAAPFAYVANTASNNVSVIDTATSPPMMVATIQVGRAPMGSPSPRMGHMPMW
jgi:YVTN family beta-propeller protein